MTAKPNDVFINIINLSGNEVLIFLSDIIFYRANNDKTNVVFSRTYGAILTRTPLPQIFDGLEQLYEELSKHG